MKSLIRYGPLVLLFTFMLAACGTQPTPSAGDIAVQQTVQAAQVCGTAVALNMANPCAPTATSTPPPTPTTIPSPTATPFNLTGWTRVTELGETPMPQGFEPDCTGLVGCPDKMYRQYVNGVPVPSEQGGVAATPGYWPYALLIIVALVVGVPIVVYGIWQSTAMSREMAKTVRVMRNLQIANSSHRRALADPDAPQSVTIRDLGLWIKGFLAKYPNPALYAYTERALQQARAQNLQTVPMETAIRLIKQFDETHKDSQVLALFTQHLSSLEERK